MEEELKGLADQLRDIEAKISEFQAATEQVRLRSCGGGGVVVCVVLSLISTSGSSSLRQVKSQKVSWLL